MAEASQAGEPVQVCARAWPGSSSAPLRREQPLLELHEHLAASEGRVDRQVLDGSRQRAKPREELGPQRLGRSQRQPLDRKSKRAKIWKVSGTHGAHRQPTALEVRVRDTTLVDRLVLALKFAWLSDDERIHEAHVGHVRELRRQERQIAGGCIRRVRYRRALGLVACCARMRAIGERAVLAMRFIDDDDELRPERRVVEATASPAGAHGPDALIPHPRRQKAPDVQPQVVMQLRELWTREAAPQRNVNHRAEPPREPHRHAIAGAVSHDGAEAAIEPISEAGEHHPAPRPRLIALAVYNMAIQRATRRIGTIRGRRGGSTIRGCAGGCPQYGGGRGLHCREVNLWRQLHALNDEVGESVGRGHRTRENRSSQPAVNTLRETDGL
eukprot:563048-Prymnesium_polylepis.1